MRRGGEIDAATEGDVELELETETRGPERPPEKGEGDQSSNLETAMSVIGDRRSREQKAKQKGKKELAIVTIKKEDVELIMTEMEISRAAAEGGLRGTHEGNECVPMAACTNR
uniref:Nascent polypeptide-associated complex subunit alpha-like UBA domain-containing protein n=1 Tax=Gorilla gorilla gorilla TaxID=9595 RepID=A0A2I2ZE20_GORGO